MEFRVNLPDEDVAFLDMYAHVHGLASRSAALHQAIHVLRVRGLGSAYQAAWSEWEIDDEPAWSTTVSDGLS